MDVAAGKEAVAVFLQLLGSVFFQFCGYIQKEVEKNLSLRKQRSSFLLEKESARMIRFLPSESFLHLRDFSALKIAFQGMELRYEFVWAFNG